MLNLSPTGGDGADAEPSLGVRQVTPPRIGHLSLTAPTHSACDGGGADNLAATSLRRETSVSGRRRESVLTEEEIMMSLSDVNWDRNKFNASPTALPRGS